MAIIENRVSEEGDVLIIKPIVPIVGIIALYDFVDTTIGEDPVNYFRKEFRYSNNGGLTFSEWLDLTTINISGVVVTKFDSFVIEYRYTAVGNPDPVNLEFYDILVSGDIADLPYIKYPDTPFFKFFNINDINVFGWALNVLEKLYVKGMILPDYLERYENRTNLEDQDFITYWYSITHYFAILVYFARQFHNFETNQYLLEEFLKSKDLILPPDRDIQALLYIYHNYVEEYKKRGTNQIWERTTDPNGVDGELIRLTGSTAYEEFIFALFRNFETGWCIGKSSPTWKGTENIINIIKGYEWSSVVADLSKYPLVEPSYVSIVSDKISISGVPGGTFSGIGYDTWEKALNVDSEMDYEVSFRVSQSVAEGCLTFGCRAFDKAGLPKTLKRIDTEVDETYFFSSQAMKLANKEYWVRGCIFGVNTATVLAQSKLNIGVGVNLRLTPTVENIIPIIGVTGGTGTVTIHDVVIRPLKLNFSRGQLGIHNIIYLISKNNNGETNDRQTETFIRENLIPYNSFLKTRWL